MVSRDIFFHFSLGELLINTIGVPDSFTICLEPETVSIYSIFCPHDCVLTAHGVHGEVQCTQCP